MPQNMQSQAPRPSSPSSPSPSSPSPSSPPPHLPPPHQTHTATPTSTPIPLFLRLYNINRRILEESRRSKTTVEEVGIPEDPSSSLYRLGASHNYDSEDKALSQRQQQQQQRQQATLATSNNTTEGGGTNNTPSPNNSFIPTPSSTTPHSEEEGEKSDQGWQDDWDHIGSDNSSTERSDNSPHSEFEEVGIEELSSEGFNTPESEDSGGIDTPESDSESNSDTGEMTGRGGGRKRASSGALVPPPGLTGATPLPTESEGSAASGDGTSQQPGFMGAQTGGSSFTFTAPTSGGTAGTGAGAGTGPPVASSSSSSSQRPNPPPLPPRPTKAFTPQQTVPQPADEATAPPEGQARLRIVSGIESTRRVPPSIPFDNLNRPIAIPRRLRETRAARVDDDGSDDNSDIESDLGSVHTSDGYSDLDFEEREHYDDDNESVEEATAEPIFPMDNPDMVPPVVPIPIPPAHGPRYKRTPHDVPRPRSPFKLDKARTPRSPSPESLLTNIITNPDPRYANPQGGATTAAESSGWNIRRSTAAAGPSRSGSSDTTSDSGLFDITNPAHVLARRMRSMKNPKFDSTWGGSGRTTGNLWDTLDPYPPSGHYHHITPQQEPEPYRGSDAELERFLRSFCGTTVKTPPPGSKNVLGYMMAKVNPVLKEWFAIWQVNLVGKWVLKHQWAGCWIGLDRKKGWYRIPMEDHKGPGTTTTGGRWPGVECLGGEGVRDTVAGRIRFWGEYFETIRKRELRERVEADKDVDKGLKEENERARRRAGIRRVKEEALKRRGIDKSHGGGGESSSDDDENNDDDRKGGGGVGQVAQGSSSGPRTDERVDERAETNVTASEGLEGAGGQETGVSTQAFTQAPTTAATPSAQGPTEVPTEGPTEVPITAATEVSTPSTQVAGRASTPATAQASTEASTGASATASPQPWSQSWFQASPATPTQELTQPRAQAFTEASSPGDETTREKSETAPRAPESWEAPTEASRHREESIKKESGAGSSKGKTKLDYWDLAKKKIRGTSFSSTGSAGSTSAPTSPTTTEGQSSPKSSRGKEVVKKWSFGTVRGKDRNKDKDKDGDKDKDRKEKEKDKE
ncbi:hypothetical protein TWF225_005470 [Orbilia oligospora]|nr:hypothetical protein TWF225_005470 [Orbilia oligospora]KAF3270792.1 hypothetical protein TWF217_007067 [Orbilia oligospora]KAF3292277.1 hypothetical protein TWF132_005667 [Orbilia oligospora]